MMDQSCKVISLCNILIDAGESRPPTLSPTGFLSLPSSLSLPTPLSGSSNSGAVVGGAVGGVLAVVVIVVIAVILVLNRGKIQLCVCGGE